MGTSMGHPPDAHVVGAPYLRTRENRAVPAFVPHDGEGVEMVRRRGHRGATARWALTVAATAVSTATLEVIAAATGVTLVASGVFHGIPRLMSLGVLAVSYVAWAVGMRVNVDANWLLLDQTGTSTNALSKLGFELAQLRSTSRRAIRVASTAGYVCTEVAKEAPYYAGAFGTALLSDSVDSTDALVFLAGTNVGAAVYEYGVARLTRAYLHKRPIRRRADDRPVSRSAEPGRVEEAGLEVGGTVAVDVTDRHALHPRQPHRVRVAADLVDERAMERLREAGPREGVEHPAHIVDRQPIGSGAAHVDADARVGDRRLGALVLRDGTRGVERHDVPHDVGAALVHPRLDQPRPGRVRPTDVEARVAVESRVRVRGRA